MAHGVVPRALSLALERTQAGTSGPGADEYRVVAAQRTQAAVDFASADSTGPLLAFAVLVAEPVDWLNARLQRLDEAGGGMAGLCDAEDA